MAKPKASTLQARFGFLDEDLKTSSHDEIMEWLDSNSQNLIQQILNWKPEWDKEFIKSCQEKAQSAVNNQLEEWQKSNYSGNKEYIEKFQSWSGLGALPEKPSLGINLKWEYTVSTGNQFVVGFIDMKAVVFNSTITLEDVKYESSMKKYMLLEHYHSSRERYSYPSWYVNKESQRTEIYFEVKSSLPSLGELIRQIRMYEEYVKGKFYVVAPDDKYAEQLQRQGIGFIKYPDGQVLS
jgi:hypothetical protein